MNSQDYKNKQKELKKLRNNPNILTSQRGVRGPDSRGVEYAIMRDGQIRRLTPKPR